jgi:hypothetical protein
MTLTDETYWMLVVVFALLTLLLAGILIRQAVEDRTTAHTSAEQRMDNPPV